MLNMFAWGGKRVEKLIIKISGNLCSFNQLTNSLICGSYKIVHSCYVIPLQSNCDKSYMLMLLQIDYLHVPINYFLCIVGIGQGNKVLCLIPNIRKKPLCKYIWGVIWQFSVPKFHLM